MLPCRRWPGGVRPRSAGEGDPVYAGQQDRSERCYDFAQIVPGWCEPVEMKSHGLRTLIQGRQRLAEMRRTAVQPRALVAEGIQRGSPESQRFDVSPTGEGPSRATAEILTNVFLRAQDATNDLLILDGSGPHRDGRTNTGRSINGL